MLSAAEIIRNNQVASTDQDAINAAISGHFSGLIGVWKITRHENFKEAYKV